jgi:hypothetical protein
MGLIRREAGAWIRNETVPLKGFNLMQVRLATDQRLTGKQEVCVGPSRNYSTLPNKFINEDHESLPLFLGKCGGRNFWIFRGVVYSAIEDLNIKEFNALLQEAANKAKAKVARAVALAEQVQAIEETGREPIPDDVKILVWRRDQGRCVRCGSNKNLEFDHIIPVTMGGSNTARNIQLLCEGCNRAKGGSLV